MSILILRSLGVPNVGSAPQSFDYYIGPSGSDSNDGLTQSTPWAITSLNTKQSTYAGKRVGLLDGTYSVYSILSGYTSQDQWALDVNGGTSGSPTVIQAVNPRQAIITAKNGTTYGNTQGTPIIGQSRSVANLGYVTFDGLKITGNPRHGIRIGTYNNPGTVSQINGITVQNCEFTDFNGLSAAAGLNLSQMEFNNCTGYVVRNCSFHDSIGYATGQSAHFSATESWGGIDGLYEYNTIKSQPSAGHMGKQSGHNGTTIRYCYMELSQATDGAQGIFDFSGMNTGGPDPDHFYNNVIVAQNPMDLRNVYFNTTDDTTHDVYCYNNTLIVLDYLSSFGFHIHIDTSRVLQFYNNIITSVATSDQAYAVINTDAQCLVNYNNYYRSSGTAQWATVPSAFSNTRSYYTTKAAFTTAMGANYTGGASADADSVTSDPQFTLTGTDAQKYQLSGGSPALTSGRSDGTSSGSACQAGGWGGVSPPSRIGCNF